MAYVNYGYHPVFRDYPGGCSLSPETFIALCTEIIDYILRAGSRDLVIINAGISTIGPLQAAIKNFCRPARIRLANVYEGATYPRRRVYRSSLAAVMPMSWRLRLCSRLRLRSSELNLRGHARAKRYRALNRSHPNKPNYSASGVYGNPKLASKKKGERLVQAMLDDLLASLA